MTRATAAIALGSNLGDREKSLRGALVALERTPGVVVLRRSSWLETAPVGGPPGQGPFLNGAVLLETTLDARALLAELQRIEAKFGRERTVRDAPRTLDLDLLLFADEAIDDPELVVPHPRMEERVFVLEPLAEILPDHVLAGCGETVVARARALKRERMSRLPDPASASAWCRDVIAAGETLGFVPTMGALHAGHLALVECAARENDRVCVSVFVNPLQFNDPRDLERYPRDFEGDADQLEAVGCSMVFSGTLAGFFPDELDATGALIPERLIDAGPAAIGLEGAHRPGHFDGVATIVDRLFDVVQPTRAYFGQKDYQQLQVVRDLARRRAGPEIIGCVTVREDSGLARSSRNALLDDAGRAAGLFLSRALGVADAAWRAGERDARALETLMREVLDGSGLELEYAAVRAARGWSAEAPGGPLESAVALVAARAASVRLIDNHVLGSDPSPQPAAAATGGSSAAS
ncbi:MAG: pantoate--beta-alanine ligase [bacterium]|nr:pantoate--beta-alanine ligase [bacterium]